MIRKGVQNGWIGGWELGSDHGQTGVEEQPKKTPNRVPTTFSDRQSVDCGPSARLLTPLISPPELKLCGIVGDKKGKQYCLESHSTGRGMAGEFADSFWGWGLSLSLSLCLYMTLEQITSHAFRCKT